MQKELEEDKTALILAGGFLGGGYERSKLYHPDFEHGFRRRHPERGAETADKT
jgi:precorrin-4 methylase